MAKPKVISVVDKAEYWVVAESDEAVVASLKLPGCKFPEPIWNKYEGQYQIHPLNLREFASRVSVYGYTVQIIPVPYIM
jgi:hypothetical protein